jgi:predicted transposase/invertase (TIGR01784 family)
MKSRTLVSFDWAIKKLLRQKANFGILEGFLTELLKKEIKIKRILESQSNKKDEYDKYNQVDLLCENEDNEIVLIELQFYSELDYFQRILFGVSKVITEYISESEAYNEVKKVYSINILYFDLGQGEDYIYH